MEDVTLMLRLLCFTFLNMVIWPYASSQKEVFDWVRQLDSPSPVEREAATRALAKLGPRAQGAVPKLVGLLLDSNPSVADSAGKTLVAIGEPARIRLAEALRLGSLRLRASETMVFMGELGVNALELYLESEPSPEAQLEVLSIIGSPGFDRILQMVDEHPTHALRALRRLHTRGRFYRRSPSSSRQIIEAVADEDLRLACNIIVGERLGEPRSEHWPRIVTWLDGKIPALRETGAWVIGIALPSPAEVVPGLTALLADADPILRKTAAWAIGSVLARRYTTPPDLIICWYLGGDAPIPIPGAGTDWWGPTFGGAPIPRYLERPRTWAWMVDSVPVSYSQDYYFQHREPPRGLAARLYVDLIPKLTDLLSDSDAGVVRAAAWSLGGAGPNAASAAPTLAKLLSSQNRRVRREAACALADIGPAAAELKEAVVRSLWDGGGPFEVYFLGTLGDSAIPELVDALSHPDPVAAEFAIMALAHLDIEPVAYREQLAAAYRKNQYKAAGFLVRTGAFGERVLGEVLSGDYTLDLRGVSAYALRFCRPPSSATLDMLRSVREDSREESELREMAAATLEIVD